MHSQSKIKVQKEQRYLLVEYHKLIPSKLHDLCNTSKHIYRNKIYSLAQ